MSDEVTTGTTGEVAGVPESSISGDDLGMGDLFGPATTTQSEEVPAQTTGTEDAASTVPAATLSSQLPTPAETAKIAATAQPAQEANTPVESGSTAEETPSLTLEQENEQLRQRLDAAMGGMSQAMQQIAQMQAGQSGLQMQLPEQPDQISSLDFLTGLNLEELLTNPEAFNVLLNRVATVSARAGQQAGYEMAMRSVPGVVQSAAQQQFAMQVAADNFYKQHADLTPFKKAVSLAAMDFYSKNPQATPEQVLEGAAVATRKILGLRGTTAGRVPAQPAATPGAVGSTSRVTPQANITSMEQQILDVINAAS